MADDAVDIKELVERNPYALMAGAVGLGFVLGGGLFTRLTARVVGAGLRVGLVAIMPLVKNEVLRAAQRALEPSYSNINKGES